MPSPAQWQKQQLMKNLAKPSGANAFKSFETLLGEAAYARGWGSTIHHMPSQWGMMAHFHCTHGIQYIEQISGALIVSANSLEAIADAIVGKLATACSQGHTPPMSLPVATVDSWVTIPTSSYYSYYSTLTLGGGSFYSMQHPVVSTLEKLVPAISTESVACPECGTGITAPLSSVVPHINDYHKWSRERIADWLETLDIDLTIRPIEKETTDGTDDSETQSPEVSIGGSSYSFVIYDDLQLATAGTT